MIKIITFFLIWSIPSVILYIVSQNSTTFFETHNTLTGIMIIHYLITILLGLIPPLFITYPILKFIYKCQYKKFYRKYTHRHNLPKYSDNHKVCIDVHEIFAEPASLNASNYYFSKYDSFDFECDMIIPLIRANRNINRINSISFNTFKNAFNIIPSSVFLSKDSKEEFNKISPKIKKDVNLETPKKKLVNHLDEDLMSND